MKVNQKFLPESDEIEFSIRIKGLSMLELTRKLRQRTFSAEYCEHGGVSLDFHEGGWVSTNKLPLESLTMKLLTLAYLTAQEELDRGNQGT